MRPLYHIYVSDILAFLRIWGISMKTVIFHVSFDYSSDIRPGHYLTLSATLLSLRQHLSQVHFEYTGSLDQSTVRNRLFQVFSCLGDLERSCSISIDIVEQF